MNGGEGPGDQQEDRRVIQVLHDVSTVTAWRKQVKDPAHGKQKNTGEDKNRQRGDASDIPRAPAQQAVAQYQQYWRSEQVGQ